MHRAPSSSVVRRAIGATALAALASITPAQIAVNPLPAGTKPSGVFEAFPAQSLRGPTGPANQTSYPYPGQCVADPVNAALFPSLGPCPPAGSFAGVQRSAGDWAEAGARVTRWKTLNPILPTTQAKFVWPVLNPPDYTPDTTTYPGADYYEIGLHEAWGFDALARAGLFPDPGAGVTVPNGMHWTGLTCNIAAGCACPADASAAFRASSCSAGGLIPFGAPLLTPVWGVGQVNRAGGPVTGAVRDVLGTCSGSGALCRVNPATPFPGAVTCPAAETCTPLFAPGTASAWSNDDYVATWPSLPIRGTRGRPVIVKWTNELPNAHVLCPHPEAADWPCAIDRTFMGVKAATDPALPRAAGVPANKVNPFGSPQQPDNSWVTHLHGGEIPPSTDGFAERWFGSKVTAPAYANLYLNPPFENPSDLVLQRPAGWSDTYTYPMVQEEALLWFHDHTLGKTHHDVIAGPAGVFPIVDPARHGGVGAGSGTCPAGLATCTPTYTWLDPVTQPRDALDAPRYDLLLLLQDRAFNEDGSIHFSNGLGQILPPGAGLPVGYTSITPGVNPEVHPTWTPEYFGDHALVNGVLWPRFTAANGWYRLRVVDGSDSRCWTIGLSTRLPAPGTAPANDVRFWVVAGDQGYLGVPAQVKTFTMCPGERYELLVNFSAVAPGRSVWMTNDAPAPFPAGVTPMAAGSPYADLNVVMRFDVVAGTAAAPAVRTCARGAINNWDARWASQGAAGQAAMLAAIQAGTACMPATPAGDPTFARLLPGLTRTMRSIPFPAGAIVRQVYLNERIDGVTLAPLGMQLNGVPFEYKVTETPRKGTREYWQFVNLTVDTHPMHPHLVKHQVVARQGFNVGRYRSALCGSSTCQPGPSPGGEMQVVPDVTPFLTGPLILPPAYEAGWKDATRAPPGQVTTIVADWVARWDASGPPSAPGTAGCPSGTRGCAAPYVYEDVTTGPYVWHCHITSHEDSEMMRTSLVVP